jgi:hypothetical protein
MSFFEDFIIGGVLGSVAANGLFLCCSGRYTVPREENRHRMKFSRLVGLVRAGGLCYPGGT